MWVDGSYGYIQCNVGPPKGGYTILGLFRAVRLQHLWDITGHRSLRQCALLLGINSFVQLLTGVFRITLWRPQISVWRYMEFIVRAQGDCRADLNVEWQRPVHLMSEWPKSGIIRYIPAKRDTRPLHMSLGEVQCLSEASVVPYASLALPWLHSSSGTIRHCISHTCLTVTCEV